MHITLEGNILLDTYSLIILAIIYIHSVRQSYMETLQNRLYLSMLQITALSLVLDGLSRFDGNPGTVYPVLNYWGNLLTFLTNLLLPSLWLLYVHCRIVHNGKRTLRLACVMIAVNAANAVMVLAFRSGGYFYYIDSNNVYHRGTLFWVSVVNVILILLSAFILTVAKRKQIEKRSYFSLVFFAVPPYICIVLQLLFYGVSLILHGVVLSLLIVYFNIQIRCMYTDYLTGVGNRKNLETHMKDKIASSNENNTFSAILIDMDNFKSINDNFGHDTGDDALSTFVKLLKACLRSDDFVARFGGDEFYIILDVSDPDVLESTVTRIKESIGKFNGSLTKPYKLEFSMGYAVYDPAFHMKMGEFQKHVDMLMYENKRITKENICQREHQS